MSSDSKIDGDEDYLADDVDAVRGDIDSFAKACVVGGFFLLLAAFSALVGWLCSFFC